MPLRGDESYVTVQGKLKKLTQKAILIETELAEGWVARSCCHFTTDRAVDDMEIGTDAEFKIMEWVANQRGFI